MILCATLAGLWLLLQRTKTDTRWRQFQTVWFGRHKVDAFQRLGTVSICHLLYSRVANIVNGRPLKVQLTQRENIWALVTKPFLGRLHVCNLGKIFSIVDYNERALFHALAFWLFSIFSSRQN